MKPSTLSTVSRHRSKRQQLKYSVSTVFYAIFVILLLFVLIFFHELNNKAMVDINEQSAPLVNVHTSPTAATGRVRATASAPFPLGARNRPPLALPDTPRRTEAAAFRPSAVAPPRRTPDPARTPLGAPAPDPARTPLGAPAPGAAAAGPPSAHPQPLSAPGDAPGQMAAEPCRGFAEAASRAALRCVTGAANRAPLSSLRQTPLTRTNTRAANENKDVGALCFSAKGSAVRRPAWASPLMNALVRDGVYQSALVLLREDPWYILIGWVSDKFMSPQKPAKQANGDVMLPQTRGRNASYYQHKYGAIWHVDFESSGMTFHFQVVHRNAIAVCVRERIHIRNYYCQPSSVEVVLEPILTYVCPCRHCHVKTEDADVPSRDMSIIPKEPLLVDPPETSYFKSSIKSSASPFEENACVDVLSAPWLVNTSVFNVLPYEGLHNDIDKLLALQAAGSGFVTVVVFNIFWRDHLHNFVYSFTQKAKLENLIVAALDDSALKVCRDDRLPCLNATVFAEHEEPFLDGKGFSRKVTEELSWVKPRLAIAVLRRGYGFLLSDLDITWNLSPLRYLVKSGVSLIHQCDSPSSLSINSGFYLALPTASVLRFFTALMTFRPDESADQNAMRLFMKYDHTHGVSHRCFPPHLFNMKCNYKRPHSTKIIDRRQTFLWRPYRLNEPPSWVMMHATCLSGAKDKIRYFRTIGAWLLEELDNKTGTLLAPKPFCVKLPHTTGDRPLIVHNVRGFTPHSSFYHEMTPDDTYLRERH